MYLHKIGIWLKLPILIYLQQVYGLNLYESVTYIEKKTQFLTQFHLNNDDNIDNNTNNNTNNSNNNNNNNNNDDQWFQRISPLIENKLNFFSPSLSSIFPMKFNNIDDYTQFRCFCSSFIISINNNIINNNNHRYCDCSVNSSINCPMKPLGCKYKITQFNNLYGENIMNNTGNKLKWMNINDIHLTKPIIQWKNNENNININKINNFNITPLYSSNWNIFSCSNCEYILFALETHNNNGKSLLSPIITGSTAATVNSSSSFTLNNSQLYYNNIQVKSLQIITNFTVFHNNNLHHNDNNLYIESHYNTNSGTTSSIINSNNYHQDYRNKAILR